MSGELDIGGALQISGYLWLYVHISNCSDKNCRCFCIPLWSLTIHCVYIYCSGVILQEVLNNLLFFFVC